MRNCQQQRDNEAQKIFITSSLIEKKKPKH